MNIISGNRLESDNKFSVHIAMLLMLNFVSLKVDVLKIF